METNIPQSMERGAMATEHEMVGRVGSKIGIKPGRGYKDSFKMQPWWSRGKYNWESEEWEDEQRREEAEVVAKKLRKQGYSTRIVETKTTITVWKGQKKIA